MSFVVGIDASRNRSGGGIRHLVGLLGAADPREHGIDQVHVWVYEQLANVLPEAEWLVKHSPAELRGSIFRQAWWQRTRLPSEARAAGVDIMLNTDAGTLYRGRPAVTMSRDMTQYEPGELHRYPFFSKGRARNLALRYVQASSLRSADGALFLTRYAADTIQSYTGRLGRVAIIPHGVGSAFRRPARASNGRRGFMRCVYVSQAELYKHQWHVVRAIAELRRRGHDVRLTLAGGGTGLPRQLLDRELEQSDPRREFVCDVGPLRPDALPALLDDADIFVFASSCENMPNTLVEGMASGLPIACSDRGPMPEVLRDGGVYFDPESSSSIATAIESLLADPALRANLARRAFELSLAYSWERCATETWAFLRYTWSATRGGN